MNEESRSEQIAALAAALREAAGLLEARAVEEAGESGSSDTLDPQKLLDFLMFFGAGTCMTNNRFPRR